MIPLFIQLTFTIHLPFAFYKELLQTWITCRGRENKSPHNFREIRKQIIWGNKYIKYKGKCLVKVNWIKSGNIFINDILDEYGHISEYKIIAKLRNKQNWIFYTPLCFLFVDFGSDFF
jgi:hypothetical protein